MLFAGISAGVAGGIGSSGLGQEGKAFAHGISRAVIAKARGQNVQAAFVSAFFAKVVSADSIYGGGSKNFGGDVDVVSFSITMDEAAMMGYEFTSISAPFCAKNVSYALSRASRFRDVGSFFPGGLHNALQGLLGR